MSGPVWSAHGAVLCAVFQIRQVLKSTQVSSTERTCVKQSHECSERSQLASSCYTFVQTSTPATPVFSGDHAHPASTCSTTCTPSCDSQQTTTHQAGLFPSNPAQPKHSVTFLKQGYKHAIAADSRPGAHGWLVTKACMQSRSQCRPGCRTTQQLAAQRPATSCQAESP